MSERAPNPFDELNVQLPGRFLTMEVVLTLLLRRAPPDATASILRDAEEILAAMESDVRQTVQGGEPYALAMFDAARLALDGVRSRVGAR